MSDRLRHVLRALSSPWAITPDGFETVCAIIDRRVAGIRLTDAEIAELVEESRAEFAARHKAASAIGRPGVGGSVAVLSIYGTILPRPVMNISGGGGTSMTAFMDRFRELDADPTVGSILLDFDSPGGSADLVPEAANVIANAQKPVTGIANTMAGSAAYWLLSQCDEVVVTPSGSVGSIGVFARHIDGSGALAQDGLKVTLISAGRFKTDGNPYEPMSDSAREYWQASVDECYGTFVDAVARGRGVNPDDVSGGMGEGRMLSAEAAVAAGMADRVATFDATVQQMLGTSTSGSGYRARVEFPDKDGDSIMRAPEDLVAVCGHPIAKNADMYLGDGYVYCSAGCACERRRTHLHSTVEERDRILATLRDSPDKPAEQQDGADKAVTFAPNAERLLARREFREANSTGR